MARVPYLNEENLEPEDRDLLGRGLNLYRALAHSPGSARAFQYFAKFLRYDAQLDPRHRELAILQIGYLARVPYSFYGHIGFVSGDFGVSVADVADVIAETEGRPNGLLPLDKTVLRAAREITASFGVSDLTFEALKSSIGLRELTELICTISFYNAALRYIKTMQIDIEPDRMTSYLLYSSQFPLPPE